MKAIGIFKVKTKISEIYETVKETHEPVLITKRGVPMVRIIPIENQGGKFNIWSQRQEFINTNGLFTEDLNLPSGEVAKVYAKIQTECVKRGRTRLVFDILIASTAVANKLILATCNYKDFIDIPGLIAEDWLNSYIIKGQPEI